MMRQGARQSLLTQDIGLAKKRRSLLWRAWHWRLRTAQTTERGEVPEAPPAPTPTAP
jgi:hypothetical protein